MSSNSHPHSHSRRNGSTSSNATFNPSASHNPAPPSSFPSASNQAYRASGSSQSTRSSTSTAINPLTSSHMESTVTRLLVATKQLLESLTEWSHGKIDEGGVSDIYVRLGNEFNAASLAFTKEGIDMNDLNSVPEDLRSCLEAALSEEASPTTLDQHLPQIRQIVVHLLQGLKVKQAKWRAAKRQQELEFAQAGGGSLSNRTSTRDSAPPDRPSVPYAPNLRGVPITRTLNGSKSREDLRRTAVASSSNANDLHRSSNSRPASPSQSHTRLAMPDLPSAPKSYDSSWKKGLGDQSGPETTGTSSSKSRVSPVNRAVRTVNELSERLRGSRASPPPPVPPPPPLPQSGSHQSPATNQNVSSAYGIPIPPIPPSPQPDHHAQASSLEALRKTDILQRRASKRFSTYTYNKIAATASPHKRSGDGPVGLGLGISVPALPLSSILPQEESNATRETTDAGRELVRSAKSPRRPSGGDGPPLEVDTSISSPAQPPRSLGRGPNDSPESQKNRGAFSPILEESETSVSRVFSPGRSPTVKTSHPVTSTPIKGRSNIALLGPSLEPGPPLIPEIFLQLGRDVKKAKLEAPPTIASLRVMFMDRFQYSPGIEDFPAIYIRDPQSGVQYQLEDMSEVKDRVVLSLNIDVLDQVKSHIDTGLSGLARELKDLKSSITTLRRQSVSAVTSNSFMIDSHSNVASPALRPTDTQFKNVARHMLHRVNTNQSPVVTAVVQPTPSLTPEPASAVSPQSVGSPNPPGSAASFSELKLQQISGSFKNQFNEVQSLRRELGVLRQLYSTFSGETKDMIATLRSQAEQVKQVASSKIAAPRTFINVGKTKLETRSQDLVTKIESLQDTVEDLKQDVTNRKMKPKPTTIISVADSIATVGKDLEELSEQIVAMKPSWKKSWEEELQNIVDEQQLLNYQEDLVKDLKEDLQAVSRLFGHVKDYLDVRKTTKLKPRDFIPSVPLVGGSGSGGNARDGLDTVLMQVKALEPKSEPRLKAIEAAERQREKNMRESKDDQFAQELAGFVGGKKLKMTGGTEETERMRKIKSEQTLKAMMMGGAPSNNVEVGGAGAGAALPSSKEPVIEEEPVEVVNESKAAEE